MKLKFWIKSFEYVRRNQQNKLRKSMQGKASIDEVTTLSSMMSLFVHTV